MSISTFHCRGFKGALPPNKRRRKNYTPFELPTNSSTKGNSHQSALPYVDELIAVDELVQLTIRLVDYLTLDELTVYLAIDELTVEELT